jgi:transcriptional antiterminator RfaH
MTGWALAATQPNAEDSVVALLTKKQLSSHLFKLRKNVIHQGRAVERLVPAFPRYIFVDIDNHWRAVRDIAGVVGFVHFGSNDPEIVDERVVDGLVAQTVDDIFPMVLPPSRFKQGDNVAIGGMGPVAGHVGIYQHALDGGRACLLFDWMGRWCPAEVDERDLELVVACQCPDKKRMRLSKRRRLKRR